MGFRRFYKINRIQNILKVAILATANVIGHPCIRHVAELNALNARENKSIPTKKLLKIAVCSQKQCF